MDWLTSFEISLVNVSVALFTIRSVDSSTFDFGSVDDDDRVLDDASDAQLGQL